MDWLFTTRWGLVCCVGAGVVLAALGNLGIAMAGWGNTKDEIIPTGWEWVDPIVGYVWLGLFAAMAVASWLAYTSGRPTATRDGRLVLCLMIVCILYPVYTLGLQTVPGLVANILVLALIIATALIIRNTSLPAAGLLLPVGLWVSIATIYLVKLLNANA
jgi:tryptophan-rich sensory protein